MKKKVRTTQEWVSYLTKKDKFRNWSNVFSFVAVGVFGIAALIVACLIMLYALKFDIEVAQLLLGLAGAYASLVVLAIVFDISTRFTREEISVIRRLNLRIAVYPHF